MFDKIQRAFHRPGTDLYRWVSTSIWMLIVVSVILLFVEPPDGFAANGDWLLAAIDDGILIIFVIELLLRVVTYEPQANGFFKLNITQTINLHVIERLRYLFQPLNLIDLITVLALVPELRALRAFRLLRLLRAAPLLQHSQAFERIGQGFAESRLLFYFTFAFLGFEVLLGAVSIYLAEYGAVGSSVTDLGDGMWWSLVTITTVGYGDIAPVTPGGKLIGGALMIGGMFTLALFAGIVGRTFVSVLVSLREDQYRMEYHINHVVVCGLTEGTFGLLDLCEAKFSANTSVVIMSEFERHHLVPPRFNWVYGDPTKEVELDKVKLHRASAALVVANRTMSPAQADAITIMTVFTLRRYLQQHETKLERQRPLYIVAEVLEEENIGHLQVAGADEVIPSTRMGFSMLAGAVSHHGSADALAEVVMTGSINLYTGPAPIMAATPFVDVSRKLKTEMDALVIGVRDPETHKETLNPKDSYVVAPGTELVYMATSAVLDK